MSTRNTTQAEPGYSAVTLRDIAQEVGICHASLYYHFPHGKEELYIEVTMRRMQRYREGEAGVGGRSTRPAGQWIDTNTCVKNPSATLHNINMVLNVENSVQIT